MARKRVPDDEITKEMLLEVLEYRAGATWVAAACVGGKYLRRVFKTCEEAVACREQMTNEGGQGNG